jgi:hypothetical protein
MASKHRYERKLFECIDSMVEEMNCTFCANATDEEMVDIKLSDIAFIERQVERIVEETLAKKLSEQAIAAKGRKEAL